MKAMTRYHIIALAILAGITFLLFYYFRSDILIIYLIAVNLVTLLIYGLDKYAAIRGWPRAPEKFLHTLAFAGGSPAALIAQKFFHHKTSKRPFQIIYWLIVLVQIGFGFYLFAR
jgi:uncharacterized membrane protein YsdA (DUF1294 family)